MKTLHASLTPTDLATWDDAALRILLIQHRARAWDAASGRVVHMVRAERAARAGAA